MGRFSHATVHLKLIMRHNPYKILIVDDEPILRKSLSLHLIKEGYDVEQAGTVIKAQEALGLLQKNSMVTQDRKSVV